MVFFGALNDLADAVRSRTSKVEVPMLTRGHARIYSPPRDRGKPVRPHDQFLPAFPCLHKPC